eukprot:scaffold13868_cov93-Skeletonema_dohrnii-CCMP3373.AAC.2
MSDQLIDTFEKEPEKLVMFPPGPAPALTKNFLSSPTTDSSLPKSITISGEEIIGDLYNSNMQLILPFAISPLGLFGPTVNRFNLYGKTIDSIKQHPQHQRHLIPLPLRTQNGQKASSAEIPSNILERANDIWRRQHPTENFGRSYKSPDPSTYYTQLFGRDVCFANGSAGLEAIALLGDGPLTKSLPNYSCHNDAINFCLIRWNTIWPSTEELADV